MSLEILTSQPIFEIACDFFAFSLLFNAPRGPERTQRCPNIIALCPILLGTDPQLNGSLVNCTNVGIRFRSALLRLGGDVDGYATGCVG